MRRLKLKKARYITGLSFAPDSSRLLVLSGYASGVEQATYVELATGATQRTFPLPLTNRFVLPADHSRLIIASDVYSRSDPLVRWCDPRNKEIKWTPLMTGAGWPDDTSCLNAGAVALTPDQNSLVIAIGQQRIAIGQQRSQGGTNWTNFLSTSRLDGAEQPVIREVGLPIVGLAAAPGADPHWAMSHANYHTGQPPEVTLHHHINAPPAARLQFQKALQAAQGLTFSPDGRLLAFHLKRDIHVLDGLTLTAIQTVKAHQKQLNAIAFSPDSRSLLSASHDGTVRVWDAATGEARSRYDWEMGPVLSLAFSPNGLTCAAGGTRGQLVIWDWDG